MYENKRILKQSQLSSFLRNEALLDMKNARMSGFLGVLVWNALTSVYQRPEYFVTFREGKVSISKASLHPTKAIITRNAQTFKMISLQTEQRGFEPWVLLYDDLLDIGEEVGFCTRLYHGW